MLQNITSSLLANAYEGFSPAFNVANGICRVNGQNVPCGPITGAIAAAFGSVFIFFIIFILAILILTIAGMWKTFQKAGHPGWASIIPIYNRIVMLQIVDKPIWWIFLYFIPVINIIIAFIVIYLIAKSFGHGVGFTLGLIFLPFIFFPILGFGKSVYTKPVSPISPTPAAPMPPQPVA